MSSLLKQCIKNGRKIVFNPKCYIPPTKLLNLSPKQFSDDGSKKDDEIQSGTILIQDGSSVQELPVIIRKVKDVLVVCEPKNQKNDKINRRGYGSDAERLRAVREEFKQCESLIEVFSLLSKCEKLTPVIAFGALERLYKLEKLSRRPGTEYITCTDDYKNSVKAAILGKMLDVIKDSDDVEILLETFFLTSLENAIYRERYFNEILVRVSDNKLSIDQACKIIDFMGKNSQISLFSDSIDKFWVVFTENEKEFSEKNLVATFKIIPYLKNSRVILLKVAERKIYSLWWKMSSQDIEDVICVLYQYKISSPRTLSVVTRWINTNIHTVSEDCLVNLLTKLTSLDYNDGQVEKALERYVKAKSVKIKCDTLIVAILNHCVNFRLRNVQILAGCGEYFIAKGENIPPMFVKSIFTPFGILRVQPVNSMKFWETLENVLNVHIDKMNPEDILDVMMSCIYLEKYPLNFIERIFSVHFLERIDSVSNPDTLRTKLKLLDTAMTLECESYKGPLLPKNRRSKSLWHDPRIKRLVNNIKTTLEDVAGGADCMSTCVIVPNIFITEIYLIDILLHPKGLKSSILNLNLRSDRNVNVAVLVHTPEHYCSAGEHLIGPQAMRIRHMRLLGMKVVSLKYETMCRLKVHPGELKKYVVSCLKKAEPAL